VAKKTVEQIDVAGKRVFIRVDFNVPLTEDGKVSNDKRIVASLPTIKSVLDRGGRLILASHLGRPKGQADPKFSLAPAAVRLGQLLGRQVTMAPDCVGAEVQKMADDLQDGQVMLLENVRFHAGETKNDSKFSSQLAKLADVYINDAFGSAHRCHSSTFGVPEVMTGGDKAVGFLIGKELKYLGDALDNPVRPFVAILGGAKVGDKIEVIRNLLGKVDHLLIGGAMSYTFFKAMGKSVGDSLLEEDKVDLAGQLLSQAGEKLLLPVDTLCGRQFKEDTETKISKRQVDAGWQGLDIGPETIEKYVALIKQAKTIVWNGPVGVFEMTKFAGGTNAIAHAVAEATSAGAISVIGGGDSASAVIKAGLADKMTHISTGGGASLEFLSGKPFKTIEILDDA